MLTILFVDQPTKPLSSRRREPTPLTARLLCYMTDEEKRILHLAAMHERLTLSGFIIRAALEKAKRILGIP